MNNHVDENDLISRLISKLLRETESFDIKWGTVTEFLEVRKDVPVAVKFSITENKYHKVDLSCSYLAISDSVYFLYLRERFIPSPDEQFILVDGTKFNSPFSLSKFRDEWRYTLYITNVNSEDYFKIPLDEANNRKLVNAIQKNIEWPDKISKLQSRDKIIEAYLDSSDNHIEQSE